MDQQDAYLRAAKNLDEAKRTLSGEPLRSEQELNAFYVPVRESVRGADIVPQLIDGLNRRLGDPRYKAFLMGRSGVGKSTEISKLLLKVSDRYVPVRFSTKEDLDPRNFKPFDVLLLSSLMIAEKTEEQTGIRPSAELLRPILEWFADVSITAKSALQGELGVELGFGIPKDSLWSKLTGLFGKIRGELKFSASREKVVVDHSLNRIDTLIDAVNRLFLECHRLLYDANGKEWLLIGEEFDKDYIPQDLTRDLFVTYGSALVQLNINLIFNLPLTLLYSSHGSGLPKFTRVMVYDTPLYTRQHQFNDDAVSNLQEILEKRMESDLFAAGQERRLILASGGQLRELFALVFAAASRARVAGSNKILEPHASRAIIDLREEFKGRLSIGDDDDTITLDEKLAKLKALYECDAKSQIPDRVFNDLIRAGHVLDFNGEHWYGPHPLAVEVLQFFKMLDEDAPGGVP